MKWVWIKQVPDTEPNADGVWVLRQISNRLWWNIPIRVKWDYLQRACDAGHHPVMYKRGSQTS